MSNNLYEISVNMHDLAGNFFMSRMFYEVTESGTPDPFQLATQLIAAWKTANELKWQQCLGQDVLIDFYKAKRVTGGGGPSAFLLSGLGGANVNSCSSAGVSADLQLQNTNATNKPAHIYFGGVPMDGLQGSQWQPPFLLKLQALLTALTTALTVGGGPATLSAMVKKLKTWTHVTHTQVNVKPVLLNKRTKPLV